MSSHIAAIQALKSLPLFRNTSLRLLADLVDLTEDGDPDDTTTAEVHAALVAVLDGVVDVRVTDKAGTSIVGRRPTGGAQVRRLARDDLAARVRASPALLRSLDAPVVEALLGARPHGRPRTHLVWLTATSGCDVPLEPLAFLLAAALARQFHEHTAVAVLRETTIELWRWQGAGFGAEEVPLDADSEHDVVAALAHHDLAFVHVIFVHPEHPRRLPARYAAMRFHRVVAMVQRPTDDLAFATKLLKPEVLSSSKKKVPYFCALVPTLLLAKPAGNGSAALRSEPIRLDDSDTRRDPAAVDDFSPAQRMRRDLCRLRIDVAAVTRRWQARGNGQGDGDRIAGIVALLDGGTPLQTSMYRWARSVTNRRVGLALSGGGASIFRVVPLIEELTRAGVPIDVVSGISGGALLAAYYCKDGIAGMRACAERGRLFQLGVLMSLVDVTPLQWLIDHDLAQATLDDLEVAFVPMATALRDGVPPEPHVITTGTLGRAVRASGAMPVLFAPTEIGGIRYADGATATPVPARVLGEFGADMVIACNCVPGPDQRNPFSDVPLGDFFYAHTPVGRVIDLWVSASGLLQRVSREAGEDSHVFLEVGETRAPLIESFRFYAAQQIAAGARGEKLGQQIRQCEAAWTEFAIRPD